MNTITDAADEQEHELLNTVQVLEKLGVSQATLHRWVNEGTFPRAISLGPRRADGRATSAAWSSLQVDQWLRDRTVATARETGFSAPSGAHIRGPRFNRAADAEAFCRGLASFGARVNAIGLRNFVVWIPGRSPERDERTLATLKRSAPGFLFELVAE